MQGLIFIPDISGFTNFVNTIPIDVGVEITRDLLNEIIDNNPLNLQLSEIEGDAVFFYKLGKPIDLADLLYAFNDMSAAFCAKYASWKAKYNIEAPLSLKLIVHYGNITVYNIRGFKKVYGEPVIESHRLLKNGSTASDYMLVTDDYMKSLNMHDKQTDTADNQHASFIGQLTLQSKKINYSCFSFQPKEACFLEYRQRNHVFAA